MELLPPHLVPPPPWSGHSPALTLMISEQVNGMVGKVSLSTFAEVWGEIVSFVC